MPAQIRPGDIMPSSVISVRRMQPAGIGTHDFGNRRPGGSRDDHRRSASGRQRFGGVREAIGQYRAFATNSTVADHPATPESSPESSRAASRPGKPPVVPPHLPTTPKNTPWKQGQSRVGEVGSQRTSCAAGLRPFGDCHQRERRPPIGKRIAFAASRLAGRYTSSQCELRKANVGRGERD